MVDVGYCINGKHGVIRNVMPISNTKTEHLCFIQANGEEQYALKKENIEYVIPSDIDNVSGKIVFDEDGVTEYSADGSVVMKGRYVEDKNLLPPKPMTFADKFKEVFGYEPNKDIFLCDVINCRSSSRKDGCIGCPFKHNNWDDPYVKAEVKNDKR